MYTNRITEAKFLLECARPSENGLIEETHAKSFERASQVLLELELHSCEETRKPFSSFIKRDTEGSASEDQNSGFIVSRKLADSNSQETSEIDELKTVFRSWNDSIVSSSDIKSSKSASSGPGMGLQSSDKTFFSGKLNREGSYVDNYNERTGSVSKWNDYLEMVPGGGLGYDGYMIGYVSPNPVGGSPRVPYTQQRRGSSYSSDNATGGCNRKLSFVGNGEQGANSGLGQAFGVEKYYQELQGQCKPFKGKNFSLDSINKGWANMGAEEDVQLPKNKYFDENTNSNIFLGSLVPLNQTECLSQKMESLALKDGYDSQAGNADVSANQEARCSVQKLESNGQVWQLPWMFEDME